VTVELSDSNLKTSYTFDIEVVAAIVNTPPWFLSTITDFNVELLDTKVVNIPASKDDQNDPITVIVLKSD
jgi:hypothetical protein